MFFSVFILVPVECEHDYLEETINLFQRDHPSQVSDVLGRCLEKKEQLTIKLSKTGEERERGGEGEREGEREGGGEGGEGERGRERGEGEKERERERGGEREREREREQEGGRGMRIETLLHAS